MVYALQKAKMYKIIYILLELYIFVRVAQKRSYIFVHFLWWKHLIMNQIMRIMYFAKGQK